LTFQLISDTKEKIENAKRHLNSLIKHEFTQLSVYSDYIVSFDQSNVNDIEKICDQCKCKFQVDVNEIKVRGSAADSSVCISKIHEYINGFMINKINNAQVLANNVQWSYSANGNAWTPYNIFLNERLENAYQNKISEIFYDDQNGEVCVLKLDALVETNRSTQALKFNIKRDDLTNVLVKIKMPDNWNSGKKNDLIVLDQTTAEYKQILSFFGDINGKLNRIISIQRVQNFRLYQQYMTHKAYFDEKNLNNTNERILFHGTTEDSVESICKFGFNRSYCGKNATIYGKGVYFASSQAYSHDYTNLNLKLSKSPHGTRNKLCGHIFVTRVLVGNVAVGNQNTETKTLPKLADNFTPVDTTVNNLHNPSIFVIYHDAQAYPEYLITYQ
jgi:poly [ADP-ribose] polymerase 10/14/15